MDARLTRNNKAGRQARGSKDTIREAPENKFESNRRRNKMFRDEFTQEALPTAPEIAGFHTCWLSTTHQYDPIHKRIRIGYTPVKADEVPGFENFRVKAGEMEGFVACNEMVLYKLPIDIYQDYMAEVHHWSPMDEQDKIKVQQEQLLNARDSNGKKLGGYEGNGYEDGFDQDLSKDAPIFS